jgi:hypothetical protein
MAWSATLVVLIAGFNRFSDRDELGKASLLA